MVCGGGWWWEVVCKVILVFRFEFYRGLGFGNHINRVGTQAGSADAFGWGV